MTSPRLTEPTTDHPRIRGEHHGQGFDEPVEVGSSPHTRGAPDARRRRHPLRRIIPAYAGSTGSNHTSPWRRPDHPRIRGEHTYANMEQESILGSSPHTRGAPLVVMVTLRGRGIIPAYAGSTRARARIALSAPDHPRIRGEHAWPTFPSSDRNGSSPHTRGALRLPMAPRPRSRIIPAYAGSTVGWAAHQVKITGSSPHTRGALLWRLSHGCRFGIIPAYAGSTPSSESGFVYGRDHPRIRGEHTIDICNNNTFFGSSPHTRGARRRLVGEAPVSGIIPAYAGSTAVCSAHVLSGPDHPRIRGEHLVADRDDHRASGSSPHTRGAPAGRATSWPRPRIIPAYAGSTRLAVLLLARDWDHPRIRGEHSRSRPASRCPRGSSPHTRGARSTRTSVRRVSGIIPAYAGSTL